MENGLNARDNRRRVGLLRCPTMQDRRGFAMSRSRMSVEEMLTVTEPWTTPTSPAYGVMKKYPLLAPLLAEFQNVKSQLLAAQKKNPKRASEQAAASLAADQEHDYWVNLIVNTIDAVASVADPDLQLVALRDWLFPRGAMHVRDTYPAEVGHALQIESELDATKKKQLKAVVICNQTLLSWVQNWIDAAHKLQATLEDRVQDAPTGGDPVLARRGFLAAVKTLEATAKLAKVTDAESSALFGQLQDTENRKVTRTTKKPDPGPAPVPEPTPAPTPPAPTDKK
jgi:hypothetical protein